MVLYIDFEWETEPLKMALSKNFTLPEKCKNHRSAPTVRCWSVALTQNCLEVVLDLTRDWRGPLLAPPPGPQPRPQPAAGARSGTPRQFLRWTFKFTSNEEEKKATKRKKKETYRMKITLPLFLQKNVFFRKNLSLLIICPFLRVFLWMQLYVFFTLILFFFLTHPSLIASLHPPPHPPNPKSSRREAIPMRSHAQKKKDKNKNWRTSVGGSGGEPVMIRWAGKRHQKKTKMTRRGRRTLTLYHWKAFFVFVWDATETC